jgi:type II restriction/modification system DNA methylase subunit YeeA
MNKTAIKNFAVWARQKLIDDIKYKAGMLGITENGIAEKLPQSTKDLQFFDIGTKNYAEVSGKEISQRNALIYAIKHKETEGNKFKEAFKYVVEEVAYTWFNRLIAIRFMEVNDYLPSGIRVLSSENKAKNEPDFVTSPFDTDLEFTPYEQDRVVQLKDENKLDELFRMLFIKQCNKLHDILPELFEKTDDYTELLLTISFTDKDGIVYRLTHDIDEDDFNIDKEGQVEIIGWMYQYYNIEPKAEVFGRKSGTKMSKEDIPAATQLFTPDWIVRYMVENSVGRIWIEGHPNNSLRSSWEYYIDEAEQEQQVVAKLEEIKATYKELSPEKIKVIDPCMGSGHILVYAFDVLMQIYESYGYTQRDAARSILQNNIFGLDIDERAYQLAYFAVMMKARQYNRRILSENIEPNLCYLKNSKTIEQDVLDRLGELKKTASILIDENRYAEEYGSVLNITVPYCDLLALEEKLEEISNKDDYTNLMDIMEKEQLVSILSPIIKQSKILAQKYEVAVTNPPYMPVSNAGAKLSDYVKENYLDSKTDLFAVFIERCKQMLVKNGYQAMITMHSWMFLSSYEKLREKMLLNDTVNMAHLGARAFEEIGGEVVQTTAFVRRNSSVKNYKGIYCRLIEPNTQQGKEDMFLSGENRYIADENNFSKIPGSTIAYWVSENFIKIFEKGKPLSSFANVPKGLSTGSVDRFMRFWYEVNNKNINYECSDCDDTEKTKEKWYPYAKGGTFRRWNGNLEYVVNWKNNGFEVKNFVDDKGKQRSRPQNTAYYFKKCMTYSAITSYKLSLRYLNHCIFGGGGDSIHSVNDKYFNYLLAFVNTELQTKILKLISPTMNFEVDHLKKLPIIVDESEIGNINQLAEENVNISGTDWDSFETSWNFKEHPLVRLSKDLWDATAVGASMAYYYGGHPKVGSPVELCYMLWQGECNERFNKLKANEEELNRIFIDIYGLQDELSPDVEDKDVTVRKADLQRDIKSLISYAVGCMFGRYSLDTEGIAYAGGDWDTGKYERFIPDADNCIPITDEEYFEDDIVGLFCAWLKKVYGEDSLEQNLDFIAKALGNKGATSREVIRNYFLNDFIKDHIKTYQKRPIYWLFDSGKQNGFKALCYMHRWNADTTGNMRVEYLHRMQRVYEKEIIRMQEIIDNSRDNKEISNATKRKEKLQKQIKETKEYDAKVAHLALSRIDIDLDDGVKVNYEKVQMSSDGKQIQILYKI